MLIEAFSEKYLKKLIGKNDIENALKRLDRLTQEEAQMADAQLLKVTNMIDHRVREAAYSVLVVGNCTMNIVFKALDSQTRPIDLNLAVSEKGRLCTHLYRDNTLL